MTERRTGITEISIQNFRGIERLDLKFLDPAGDPTRTVVLGGPNGSGKTAVLEASLIACGYENLVNGSKGKAAIKQGAGAFQIDITAQHFGVVQSSRATTSSPGQHIAPCAYFSSWRAPQLVGALGITAGKRGKRPAENEHNRLLNIKQFLINARAHEFFPSAAKTDGSRYEKIAEKINHVWNLFFPGHSFVVEPVGSEPEDGFDLFLLQGDDRIPVDSLSSGQLEVFMMAGTLSLQGFDEGLILIDEPELHLDPQWHRILMKALLDLKPSCQILVATHSPEIFDSVMSYERHFLIPEDDPRSKAWMSAVSANDSQ